MEFEFKYLENRFLSSSLRPTQTTDSSIANKVLPTPKEWPTVKALLEEFKRLVLTKVTPLLGKNIQITGVVLASQAASISVPLYEFGLGNRNAGPSETSLSFVLQPVLKKGSYRLYVKGASLELLKTPLSETDLATIYQFEMLFTAVISMLNENIKLQYVRNNDALISCVFRGPVQFVTKTAKEIKRSGRPRRATKKP